MHDIQEKSAYKMDDAQDHDMVSMTQNIPLMKWIPTERYYWIDDKWVNHHMKSNIHRINFVWNDCYSKHTIQWHSEWTIMKLWNKQPINIFQRIIQIVNHYIPMHGTN